MNTERAIIMYSEYYDNYLKNERNFNLEDLSMLELAGIAKRCMDIVRERHKSNDLSNKIDQENDLREHITLNKIVDVIIKDEDEL